MASAAEEIVEQNIEQAAEQGAEQAAEQGAEQAAEQGAEQSAEQAAEQGAEQSAEQAAEQGAEQSAEQAAEQGAEESAEKGAEASSDSKGNNSNLKKTLAVAATLGIGYAEYKRIEKENEGCYLPSGCLMPTPLENAYKGTYKSGQVDPTIKNKADCETKYGGTLQHSNKLTKNVSKSKCNSEGGKFKSCDLKCVASNTPNTVGNQITKGIHTVTGLIGDALKYAKYALYIICGLLLLSLIIYIFTLF